MIRKKENVRGVTLIVLVITIVVLLILAGVTIAALSGDNGILKRAVEAREETNRVNKEEEENLKLLINSMNSVMCSTEGFVKEKNVNSPKITNGMIPIKWENENWVVCSQEDNSWYNYDYTKKWANVMLSDGTYKADTVKVGQVVEEKDLGSMYVWIPRYAYQIVADKNIKVTFLKGNTNEGVDGVTYTEDQTTDTRTTAIVHPAFNLGGTELKGFWMAKFEASGTNKDGNAVGNASASSGAQQYAPDSTTIAKSLPNKISWRHITIGESEKRSMDIATTAKTSFGLTSATSHLIKNSEWGAVAYLCYSECGAVPMTNGTGVTIKSYWYNLYTGQGPKSDSDEGLYSYDVSHNYSTINGLLSSTTRNITGVYDMAGGALELVAGYLDNGNGNLDAYGVSNDGTKYFEGGKLKSAYTSLWDKYDVSEEEKNNKVTLSDGTVETGLWDGSKTALKYQEARYKLTKYNYDKMTEHKGIGINETASSFAFFAPDKINGSWNWFTTAANAVAGSASYGYAWDSEYVLLGHMRYPFLRRGGGCKDNNNAGVLCLHATGGFDNSHDCFRAVIIV